MNILEFPNNSKHFDKLSMSCIENEKFAKAIIYIKKAIETSKNKQDRRRYMMRLSGLYLKIGQVEYSNELLFDILSDYPYNKEAYLSLMFNMPLTTDGKKLGEYYFKKCKIIFDRLNIEINNEDEIAEIIDDENEFLDEFLEKIDKKSKFIVINKKTRFHDHLTDAYIELSVDDCEMAIHHLNLASATQNLSVREKSEVCNAFACCYYNLDEKEKCFDSLVKSFEFEQNNIDCLCLMLAFAEKYDQRSDIEMYLDNLEKCTFDDEIGGFKIISNLNNGKRYIRPLEIVDKLLNDKPFDYNLNKIRAILFFNLGQKTRAKNIFIEQNKYYGDLCDAKYYLHFINMFSNQNFLPIKRILTNWEFMTNFYVKKATAFLALSDEDAKSRFNSVSFRDGLEWLLSLLSNFELTRNVIKKLLAMKDKTVNQWFLKKLCNDSNIENQFKMEIITQLLMMGYLKAIPYVFETKFDIFKFKYDEILNSVDKEFFEGYCRACVLSKFKGENSFKPLTNALKVIQNVISQKDDKQLFNSNIICWLLLRVAYDIKIANNFYYVNFDEKELEKIVEDFKL